MIEVTIQDAKLELVPIGNNETVLRIIDETFVFNVCLAGAALLDLMAEITLKAVA